MNITAWLFFGLVNGLIITYLEPDSQKSGLIGAVILGMLGALTGGMLAFLLLGGVSTSGFSTSFLNVAFIEAMLLFMLMFGKLFRKVL